MFHLTFEKDKIMVPACWKEIDIGARKGWEDCPLLSRFFFNLSIPRLDFQWVQVLFSCFYLNLFSWYDIKLLLFRNIYSLSPQQRHVNYYAIITYYKHQYLFTFKYSYLRSLTMYVKYQISAVYLFIVKPRVTLELLRVECRVFSFFSAKRSLGTSILKSNFNVNEF